MSRYNIENFKLSFSKLDNQNMDQEIFDILADIAKKLNCSIDKGKKKIDNEKYWESIRNFKATQVKNNSDDETKYIQNIRKILNIITESNSSDYFDEIYNNLLSVKENFGDKYEIICEDVYKLLSTNYLYSKSYCNIFGFLIKKENIFKLLLDSEIINFEKLFDNLIYISPDENYEKFCEYNKSNEKRRAKITFYSNLYLINIINDDDIYRIENILFDITNKILNIENKKNEIDEFSEYNYILVTTIFNNLNNNNKTYANILFNKVSEYSNYKVKDFKSITNKCIFKHMDIIDELS